MVVRPVFYDQKYSCFFKDIYNLYCTHGLRTVLYIFWITYSQIFTFSQRYQFLNISWFFAIFYRFPASKNCIFLILIWHGSFTVFSTKFLVFSVPLCYTLYNMKRNESHISIKQKYPGAQNRAVMDFRYFLWWGLSKTYIIFLGKGGGATPSFTMPISWFLGNICGQRWVWFPTIIGKMFIDFLNLLHVTSN